MNEEQFAQKLKPWLERSAGAVGEIQATRLKAARLRALDAVGEPVRLLGQVTVTAGTAQTLRYSVFQRALLWLPVAALLATLALQSAKPPEAADIDAQLLTQELPPAAYLDQDFRAWLAKSQS